MTPRPRAHRICALAALALLAPAPIALAGPSAAGGEPPSAAPARTPDPQGKAEDRVFALVQAGRCAQAKAAALQENDPNLAEQIGLMCGAKSSGASPKGGGGARRGGGAGGGRRGGS